MKKILANDIKKLQVDMLRKIHDFCVENGIVYTLAHGTLIGAIRHHGYIPWDDDIDIMMPRPDYNRFLSLFNGKVENLRVLAPEIDVNYYAPYGNICDERTLLIESGVSHRSIPIGIKIDVFPVDGVPEDDLEFEKCMKKMLFYNKVLYFKRKKFGSINGLKDFSIWVGVRGLLSVISYGFVQKKIMKLAAKNNYNESKYVAILVFPSHDSFFSCKRIERVVFDSTVKVEFENNYFFAPKGYDSYLRTFYGDYMQLPSKEKRIPHHGFTAYWID